MSLLSPSLRIALTPGRVALASRTALREAAVATPGWAGALEALKGLVHDLGARGRARVTLSHHFAQVHLLPSPPVLLGPSEMQGWIRDSLARQYGEVGEDWQVAWQPQPPGKPFVAASLAALAMTELVETLHSAGVKPVAIQPLLSTSWRRLRRRIGGRRGWYALAEPGRVTLARVAGGRFEALRSALVAQDPVPALSGLIRRESLLAGTDAASAPLWLDCLLVRHEWRGLEGGLELHAPAAGSETLGAWLGA